MLFSVAVFAGMANTSLTSKSCVSFGVWAQLFITIALEIKDEILDISGSKKEKGLPFQFFLKNKKDIASFPTQIYYQIDSGFF